KPAEDGGGSRDRLPVAAGLRPGALVAGLAPGTAGGGADPQLGPGVVRLGIVLRRPGARGAKTGVRSGPDADGPARGAVRGGREDDVDRGPAQRAGAADVRAAGF